MKKTNTFLAILLLMMAACGEGNKQATEIITVDVSANYPEKELILQDIMDVEYVPLETTDEFITKGVVKAIGKEILLITNQGNDGDILVFDRKTGRDRAAKNIHIPTTLLWMKIKRKCLSQTMQPGKYWCTTCRETLREVSNIRTPATTTTCSIMTGTT